jgi:hypothetical protein
MVAAASRQTVAHGWPALVTAIGAVTDSDGRPQQWQLQMLERFEKQKLAHFLIIFSNDLC